MRTGRTPPPPPARPSSALVDRLTYALVGLSGRLEDDKTDPGEYDPGLPTVREFAERIALEMERTR